MTAIYIVRGVALAIVAVGAFLLLYVGWHLSKPDPSWATGFAQSFLLISAFGYAKTVVNGVRLLWREGRKR